MIASLEGIVAEIDDGSLTLQVGPVGVHVLAPTATLARCSPGRTVELHTYLAVREDALTLYGFHSVDLRELFELLLSVSGIGPKLALAVLGTLAPQVIATAVAEEDPDLLSAAPGVGTRTAERIILELRSKLPEHLRAAGDGAERPRRELRPAAVDAIAALLALGYRESQVKPALSKLAADHPEDEAEALIRRALAELR